jgi:hypothetical protein
MVNRGSGSSVPVKVARKRKYEEIEKARSHPVKNPPRAKEY